MDIPGDACPSQPSEQELEARAHLTMTGKMMAATVDLRIQRTARQSICTRVKRWMRRRGTCRRKAWSGWCLAGIRKSLQRSQNWRGQSEVQPGSGDLGGSAGGLGLSGGVPRWGLIEQTPWSGFKDTQEGDWRS